MKNKFNQQLLAEEVKKFKMLSEYTFITGDDDKPLLLGANNLDEVDEAPSDLKPEDSAEKIANELGIGDQKTDAEPKANQNADQKTDADPNAKLANDLNSPEMDDNQPMDDEMGGETTPEMGGDEVEVDVTSLVKGSEEAKQSADKASQNSEMLLQKLSDLEARVANMTAITNKIDTLEKEIIKRNPTPVEKLEMRSLDSYPFNQKLTDYWADKEGPYDVMKTDKKKEYVLTQDDVNKSFNDGSVKDSFKLNESAYEEENINDFEEEDI